METMRTHAASDPPWFKDRQVWAFIVLYVASLVGLLAWLQPWNQGPESDTFSTVWIWLFLPMLAYMFAEAAFLCLLLVAGWGYWLWRKITGGPLPEKNTGGLWD